jgi:hypothetical protein
VIYLKESPLRLLNFGKIDGCFATAFKAKVLLYKASPQFNPSNKWDNAYWKEAYAANEAAYNKLKGLGYALTPDYANIFLNERGPEVVSLLLTPIRIKQPTGITVYVPDPKAVVMRGLRQHGISLKSFL